MTMVAWTLPPAVLLMAAARAFRLFAAGVIVCGTPPIDSVKVELPLMLWIAGSVTVGRVSALMELEDDPASVTCTVYTPGSAPAPVLAVTTVSSATEEDSRFWLEESRLEIVDCNTEKRKSKELSAEDWLESCDCWLWSNCKGSAARPTERLRAFCKDSA